MAYILSFFKACFSLYVNANAIENGTNTTLTDRALALNVVRFACVIAGIMGMLRVRFTAARKRKRGGGREQLRSIIDEDSDSGCDSGSNDHELFHTANDPD